MQPVDTNEEIEQLRGEMWFSLEEFEKRLENDMNSWKLEKIRLIESNRRKI